MGGACRKSDSLQWLNQASGSGKQDTKTIYYRSEFRAMGDVVIDGTLTKPEFFRMLSFLGISDTREAEMFWCRHVKKFSDKITEDEYINMMTDPEFDEQSNMWRKLFLEFDHSGDGKATRKDFLAGLEKLGISLNEDVQRKLSVMDTKKRGYVHYGEFLKLQIFRK